MSDQNQQPTRRRRPKKAKGHGGHHGGAWKVAYADFVTAMMALFLVLWLVSQADTKLKEQIANYFRSPGVFDSMDGGILSQAKKVSKEPTALTSKDDEQTLFSVAQSMQKKFSKRPEFSRYKDQVKVELTEEGLRIQLIDSAERVSFPSGSAELTAEAKKILYEIALGICALPNKVNIGGHTDSHVFPNEKGYTNWELSADRANAARRVLETACVKPEQIHRIIGYADTEPLIPDDPFAEANRRISITVLRLNVSSPVSEESPSDEAQPEKKVSGEIPDPTNQTGGRAPRISPENRSFKPKVVTEETPEPGKDKKSGKKEGEPPDDPVEKSKKRLENSGAVRVGEPDLVPGRSPKPN